MFENVEGDLQSVWGFKLVLDGMNKQKSEPLIRSWERPQVTGKRIH